MILNCRIILSGVTVMHELSIAVNIVEVVTEQLEDFPGGHVLSVKLRIGEASGVDAGQLRFAFPIAADGTALEGADLMIDTVHLAFRCRACNHSPLKSGVTVCPRCQSGDIELAAGDELEIASFELITPDEVSLNDQ